MVTNNKQKPSYLILICCVFLYFLYFRIFVFNFKQLLCMYFLFYHSSICKICTLISHTITLKYQPLINLVLLKLNERHMWLIRVRRSRCETEFDLQITYESACVQDCHTHVFTLVDLQFEH